MLAFDQFQASNDTRRPFKMAAFPHTTFSALDHLNTALIK
jgi:hypothetical protein